MAAGKGVSSDAVFSQEFVVDLTHPTAGFEWGRHARNDWLLPRTEGFSVFVSGDSSCTIDAANVRDMIQEDYRRWGAEVEQEMEKVKR